MIKKMLFALSKINKKEGRSVGIFMKGKDYLRIARVCQNFVISLDTTLPKI